MPNENTITKPISLVGTGRSGTTLLTNVFRRHPDFESYGETANLIFPSYYHAERCLPFCKPKINESNSNEYATSAIRSMMNGVFYDEKEYWFHKPIMLTNIRNSFDSHDEFSTWYWKTFRNLFPNGFTFTVVRKPEQVIPSYMRRWGQSFDQASQNYLLTCKLILNSSNCIDHVILFEELVHNSKTTLHTLFEKIGCDYHEGCLEAFNKLHAPNTTDGKIDSLDDAKSRHLQSDQDDIGEISNQITEYFDRLNEKYHLDSKPLSQAS